MSRSAYGLSDVVNDNGTVRVPVIHRRQRLVSLLASGIPYLKLDCRIIIKSDGLGQEGGSDGRLSVIVELILSTQLCDK